jgi:hypothetical protein
MICHEPNLRSFSFALSLVYSVLEHHKSNLERGSIFFVSYMWWVGGWEKTNRRRRRRIKLAQASAMKAISEDLRA